MMFLSLSFSLSLPPSPLLLKTNKLKNIFLSGHTHELRDTEMSHYPSWHHIQDWVWRSLFHGYNFLWIKIWPCYSYLCPYFSTLLNRPVIILKMGQPTSESKPLFFWEYIVKWFDVSSTHSWSTGMPALS